jgi:hypothetical protein
VLIVFDVSLRDFRWHNRFWLDTVGALEQCREGDMHYRTIQVLTAVAIGGLVAISASTTAAKTIK